LGQLSTVSALCVAGSLLAGVGHAGAGGVTFVAAPDELGEADCRQGRRAQTVGFESNVAVIGCGRFDGEELLLAADQRRGTACTWVVPAGGKNYEDCAELDSSGSGSPRNERPVVATYLRATRALSAPYVVGLARPGIARAYLRYGSRDGPREASLDVIEVDPDLGPRLGSSVPPSYVLGVVPTRADTCGGITLEGRDGDGNLVGVDRLTRGSPFDVGVALPGSDRCDASPVAETVGKAP